jgi:hypothetical protein
VARTAPVITGGDGPAQQRVAYGTADGRVHLRVLASGAEVGPPGGIEVADATLTDPALALGSGFVSSSSEAALGVLFVVHDDGGGVEVARLDERTGQRLGPDVAVPGSLGCAEAGAPLLTPVAADGTRLLFLTIAGRCPGGEGLVRFGVGRGGELAPAGSAQVPGVEPGPAPALAVVGGAYFVAVARIGGVDLWKADGPLGVLPELGVAFDPAERPAALTVAGAALYALTDPGKDALLRRVALDGAPQVTATAQLSGDPVGLAVSPAAARAAAVTSGGLAVLDLAGLSPLGHAAATGPPSIGGELVFSGGQVVRLADAVSAPLGDAPALAPALARGYVAYGPVTYETDDATAPEISLRVRGARRLEAVAADDRGVASVVFRLDGRRLKRLASPTRGSAWADGRYVARLKRVAPGRHRAVAIARDRAGNAKRARRGLTVGCERRVRGRRRDDILRGRRGRDCLSGRGGADRLLVRGGGADRVRCGPGRDTVRADRSDRVAADCEGVRWRT